MREIWKGKAKNKRGRLEQNTRRVVASFEHEEERVVEMVRKVAETELTRHRVNREQTNRDMIVVRVEEKKKGASYRVTGEYRFKDGDPENSLRVALVKRESGVRMTLSDVGQILEIGVRVIRKRVKKIMAR